MATLMGYQDSYDNPRTLGEAIERQQRQQREYLERVYRQRRQDEMERYYNQSPYASCAAPQGPSEEELAERKRKEEAKVKENKLKDLIAYYYGRR